MLKNEGAGVMSGMTPLQICQVSITGHCLHEICCGVILRIVASCKAKAVNGHSCHGVARVRLVLLW